MKQAKKLRSVSAVSGIHPSLWAPGSILLSVVAEDESEVIFRELGLDWVWNRLETSQQRSNDLKLWHRRSCWRPGGGESPARGQNGLVVPRRSWWWDLGGEKTDEKGVENHSSMLKRMKMMALWNDFGVMNGNLLSVIYNGRQDKKRVFLLPLPHQDFCRK